MRLKTIDITTWSDITHVVLPEAIYLTLGKLFYFLPHTEGIIMHVLKVTSLVNEMKSYMKDFAESSAHNKH